MTTRWCRLPVPTCGMMVPFIRAALRRRLHGSLVLAYAQPLMDLISYTVTFPTKMYAEILNRYHFHAREIHGSPGGDFDSHE